MNRIIPAHPFFFFFNDTATTEIYTLSLHDALPICRGIQLLNVFLGGTLFQDLPSERPAGVRHAGNGARHGLTVERGSTMCATLGATTLDVNSRHHQAVRHLAADLLATAWAEDGLIEGAEAKDGRRVLAVQWHPEDEHGDALFRGFARA